MEYSDGVLSEELSTDECHRLLVDDAYGPGHYDAITRGGEKDA